MLYEPLVSIASRGSFSDVQHRNPGLNSTLQSLRQGMSRNN
jgi:hypothetical protein